MKLQHVKNFLPALLPTDGEFKQINAIAWSSNGLKIAVAYSQSRQIDIFDEDGKQRDSFKTRPAKGSSQDVFEIVGLSWSPECDKLAVAQNDGQVYVYRIGVGWEKERKKLVNIFPHEGQHSSAITTLVWPLKRPSELIFGCADGSIYAGVSRKAGKRYNRSQQLFGSDAYVVSMCTDPGGEYFATSHTDRSVYIFQLGDFNSDSQRTVQRVTELPFVASALAWGHHVICAGNTREIHFLERNGEAAQIWRDEEDPISLNFTCAQCNPTGQGVVIGGMHGFLVFSFHLQKQQWDLTTRIHIPHLLNVTCLRWKLDGSRLISGSSLGALDMFDIVMRRFKYGNNFEITYTSLSTIVVRQIDCDRRLTLSSNQGYEITSAKVIKERVATAQTASSLLVGDFESGKTCEIFWQCTGDEKFILDDDVLLLSDSGELSVIEFGENAIAGSVRTEFVSNFTVSYRSNGSEMKRLAYLLDRNTVRIVNLVSNGEVVKMTHDNKITWLELSEDGGCLLFSDNRNGLYLINGSQSFEIMSGMKYAQWVPNSTVIVAQSLQNLVVWYNAKEHTNSTTIPIRGEVVGIRRTSEETAVIVDEGVKRVEYHLEERLIRFGSALHDQRLADAVVALEPLGLTEDTQSMWKQLSGAALKQNQFSVAQQCFSMLRELPMVDMLQRINDAPKGTPDRQALVAILNRQLKRAEKIYLSHNMLHKAIWMYIEHNLWESALSLAEYRNFSRLEDLRKLYFSHLIETKQFGVAGEVKEAGGEHSQAISLYLQAGVPFKAAQVLLNSSGANAESIDQVGEALEKQSFLEEAGDFYEQIGRYEKSLQCYIDAKQFDRAVDLSRATFPAQVVELEAMWGDHLMEKGQLDLACSHFIQAGQCEKAIECAIEGGKLAQATKYLKEYSNPEDSAQYYLKIAGQFQKRKEWGDATKYFAKAGCAEHAVRMYVENGEARLAHAVARKHLGESQLQTVFMELAGECESSGDLEKAENLYLQIGEHNCAVDMYSRARLYGKVIDIVSKYEREDLSDTYIHLAKQLENDGNLPKAEEFLLESGRWKLAVHMYRSRDMWDDAKRVAQEHGGLEAYNQIVYDYAVAQGGEAGIKILQSKGLMDLSLDYAIDQGEWNKAFEVANNDPRLRRKVEYQYAIHLENEGNLAKAEEFFVRTENVPEAIQMYVHQQDWASALRVARTNNCFSMVAEVYVAQGDAFAQKEQFEEAENAYVTGNEPMKAIDMHKQAGNFDRAKRLAREHAPHLIDEIENEHIEAMSGSGHSGVLLIMKKVDLELNRGNFTKAVQYCLTVKPENCANTDELLTCWHRGLEISNNARLARHVDYIKVVTQKMQRMSLPEKAVEVMVENRLYEDAVEIALGNQLFDIAKRIAEKFCRGFLPTVKKTHEEFLLESENMTALGEVNSEMALKTLVEQKRWEEAYALTSDNKEEENVVSMAHAKATLRSSAYQCVEILIKHGYIVSPDYLKFYKVLMKEMLRERCVIPNAFEIWNKVNDVIFEVRKMLDQSGTRDKVFNSLQRIVYMAWMKFASKEHGLRSIHQNCCLALVRYINYLPVDVCFYDLGEACRDNDDESSAFIFFNTFIDICDAIDDSDHLNDISEEIYENTCIPSLHSEKVKLPRSHLFSEEDRADIRQWVLEIAVEGDLERTLPTRTCMNCNQETFLGNQTCHHCQHKEQLCIITGLPLTADHVKIPSSGKLANREDFNRYIQVMRRCPWSREPERPIYGNR